MRVISIICLAAFSITLGVTVAYRMHTEAMAVVVGVLCGVSASIPVSLLVLFAARQSQRATAAQQAQAAPTWPVAPYNQPQILVVPGPYPTSALPWPPAPGLQPPSPAYHDHTQRLDRFPYEIEVSDD